MLPTSAKVPDRFKPDGADVTYLIEIPNALSKARYRRAVTASGALIWAKAALVACAKEAIEELQPENAAAMLDVCDRYQEVESLPSADGASEDQAIKDALKAWQDKSLPAIRDWNSLSRILHKAGGEFASRVADNQFWNEVAPIFAARSFLLGTDTLKLKRGADGLLPEATIDAISEDHQIEIGWRALELFSPSEAQAKNSASPRPSPSDAATSIAENSPQTEVNGISAEIDTNGTQS